MTNWNHKEPQQAVDLTHYKSRGTALLESPIGRTGGSGSGKIINLTQRQSRGWQAWAELALLIREDTRGRVWCMGPHFNPKRRAVGLRLWDSYNDCAFVIYSRAEWADWKTHNGWGGNDAA